MHVHTHHSDFARRHYSSTNHSHIEALLTEHSFGGGSRTCLTRVTRHYFYTNTIQIIINTRWTRSAGSRRWLRGKRHLLIISEPFSFIVTEHGFLRTHNTISSAMNDGTHIFRWSLILNSALKIL